MKKKTLFTAHRLMKTFILSIVGLLVLFYATFATDFKLFCQTHTGIDLSHHNNLGENDWKILKNNKKVDFVYIKATQGLSYKDPMRFTHAELAEKNGIAFGYYHFFEDNVSPKLQFQLLP